LHLKGLVLHLKGLVVHSIKSLSSPSSVRDNSRREMYSILKSSWLPSDPASLYNPPHPDTIEEAFLTTVTADTVDASNDIMPIRPHSFDWNAIGIERLALDNQELSIYASDVIGGMRWENGTCASCCEGWGQDLSSLWGPGALCFEATKGKRVGIYWGMLCTWVDGWGRARCWPRT
jgi:hypothetical protein